MKFSKKFILGTSVIIVFIMAIVIADHLSQDEYSDSNSECKTDADHYIQNCCTDTLKTIHDKGKTITIRGVVANVRIDNQQQTIVTLTSKNAEGMIFIFLKSDKKALHLEDGTIHTFIGTSDGIRASIPQIKDATVID